MKNIKKSIVKISNSTGAISLWWRKRPRLCLSAESAVKKSKGFWILVLPTVMSKIQNVFIKQHQRGRWRYPSLFTHLWWRTLPSVCLISIKTRQKLTALYLLSLAHVRKRTPAYIFMTKKMRSFPQTFFISKNTWKNDRTLIPKSTLFNHNKFRCRLSFDEFTDRIQHNTRVFGGSKNLFFRIWVDGDKQTARGLWVA